MFLMQKASVMENRLLEKFSFAVKISGYIVKKNHGIIEFYNSFVFRDLFLLVLFVNGRIAFRGILVMATFRHQR